MENYPELICQWSLAVIVGCLALGSVIGLLYLILCLLTKSTSNVTETNVQNK